MTYRSWLIVPGNNEEMLAEAVGTGADAVIVDLDNMVPRVFKSLARLNAAEWLKVQGQHIVGRPMGRWVRINALDSEGVWREDLQAVMPSAPEGIILPRAESPEAIRQLAAEMYELEQRHHIHPHSTKVIPLVGETPRSALTIGQYLEFGHQRLVGLGWEADDLSASLCATRKTDDAGEWTDALRFVRAQVLLTAHATGLMAIESAHAAVEDRTVLAIAARGARGDGFSGMLAVHPEQVAVINEAFMPSPDELREAREIIEAFDAMPEAGALQYKGRMLDRPQLGIARRLLEMQHAGQRNVSQAAPILRPA